MSWPPRFRTYPAKVHGSGSADRPSTNQLDGSRSQEGCRLCRPGIMAQRSPRLLRQARLGTGRSILSSKGNIQPVSDKIVRTASIRCNTASCSSALILMLPPKSYSPNLTHKLNSQSKIKQRFPLRQQRIPPSDLPPKPHHGHRDASPGQCSEAAERDADGGTGRGQHAGASASGSRG